MAKKKLTPHQTYHLNRLSTTSWKPGSTLGAQRTFHTLVEKGHAERKEARGPRGGVSYRFRRLP